MMGARATLAMIVLAGTASCSGRTVDLGGAHARALCRADTAPAGSCSYTGAYNDGSGYFGAAPSSCRDPVGNRAALASTADVATALAGTWTGCSGSALARLIDPSGPDAGIQLTSDGRYSLLNEGSDGNLTPANDPNAEGTFTVVDASASLGPGVVQVRFTADAGGVSLSQVIVFSSPPRLRFFVPETVDYVPSLTWKFRTGICGPGIEAPGTCTDQSHALSAMQGRWVWCSGDRGGGAFGFGSAAIGLEIRPDSTWNTLIEDSAGSIVPDSRAPDAGPSHGTLQVNPDGLTWVAGSLTIIAPWLPIFDPCRRVMAPWPEQFCNGSDSSSCWFDLQRSQIFVRLP